MKRISGLDDITGEFYQRFMEEIIQNTPTLSENRGRGDTCQLLGVPEFL